ncbi:hypothetical protein D3C73_1589500 [compost metagenome]
MPLGDCKLQIIQHRGAAVVAEAELADVDGGRLGQQPAAAFVHLLGFLIHNMDDSLHRG